MISLKFKCIAKNESLNGTQKTVNIGLSSYNENSNSANYNPGAVLGTPNTSVATANTTNQETVQVTTNGLNITFVGNTDDAGAFALGEIYTFSLDSAPAVKNK